MLAKEFFSRRPFAVGRLPVLARLYRQAHLAPATMWRSRGRRVFFSVAYALWRSGNNGFFEYERLGERRTVRFNARNLQFQALYAPFFQGGYEPDVALLLDALLPEGGVFFDIGSNWGYFSLYAASNHQALAIHAFEPFPSTYADLIRCVEQAGIAHLVTCHQVALSEADGDARIHLPDRLHSGQATVSASGGTRVPTRRLDSMKLPRPDFIKMDVEGHEIEVLRGAVETLRMHKPFLIFENTKPYHGPPETVLEPLFFLQHLGYRLYAPAIQRAGKNGPYYNPAAEGSASSKDLFVLLPMTPQLRRLWGHDLNVFACHEERVAELDAVFKS